MHRNFFKLLLSAALMMCCTVMANAQLGTPPNDEIWYTTTDGQVCNPLQGCSFGSNALIISNTYENGHGTIKFDRVPTAIADVSFKERSNLTSVSIPGSVTSIGSEAFCKCDNLTSISIPNGVTNIGSDAFFSCAKLASVIIPGSVTSIGHDAFGNCKSLTSVTIPNSVTRIENHTFNDCDGLTSVTIPSSVTSIGDGAFGFNENLTDIFFLGNDNITLGDRIFYNTPATIYVADTRNFSSTWQGRPVRSWRSDEGNGTKEKPYEIEDFRTLYGFSLDVFKGNTGICGKLTADITMNTGVLDSNGNLNRGAFMEWTPIGGQENSYSGEFNGNGHTISGLYVNDASMDCAALFGKIGNAAYIHDLGVKDSYFRGNIWVAGICGDFASGKIENCWNGATVIGCHSSSCAGGIAGSCWKNASVSGCYNIGKVSVESGCSDSQCGGICGIVARNDNVTYSVSNCVSLKGKCEEAYNVYTENYNYSGFLPNESYSSIGNASVDNVFTKDASAFKSGEVCWKLNGNKKSTAWRQQIGKDSFPLLTGDYLVYYDNDNKVYLNESMCDKTDDHLHTFESRTMPQGSSTINYWHCTACGNDYQFYNRAYELPKTEYTKPSAGDGSKESPYQIATLENLLWFADYVNSGNASACAILTADITMNASVLDSYGRSNGKDFFAWTPIGGQNGKDYSGEFNGQGHTISGLYFKDTNTNNVGLFGKAVNNAYIHDLGIKDSYFYGKNHVGGICGDFANGKIENCWNGATVMAYDYDAGGISGSCWKYASIANCYNIGDVSTYEEKGGGLPDSRFGGICGSVYSNENVTYTIGNCYTLINNGGTDEDAAERAKLPHTNCNKIYGFLAEGCPPSKIHDSYVKKATDFISGEVCYRLNRGMTDGSQKWYQTLGEDPSPVLNNNRGTVYYGYDGNVLKYSNTTLTIPTAKHEQCAATCNSVGYSQDCWEDTKTGKIYAEAACLHELNQTAVISYIPSAADPTYQINQGDVTDWTQETNKTYDGVNFGYAAVKVFKDYDGTNDNYGTDEWASFKVAEANPKNARLKWAWTGDRSKQPNGRYGDCDLYYKVNNGDETKITTSTSFEVSPDVYVLNLGNLSQNDVVEFHIKSYGNRCSVPNEVTWAVTLEYVSVHNIEHVAAKAATCTEKGNKEYWYCTKCKTYFADAECTTVMTDWEISALGHTTEYHPLNPATCTENGNIEYWHCTRCNLNYSDATCKNQITGSVVLSATHHANKEHIDYKAPTADDEGNIEYWHCLDCGKKFGDMGCTKEVTDADIVLAKLLNVLHIDFTDASAPIEKEHYMNATEIGFTEKGDITFTVNEQEVTYSAGMIKEIGFFNGTPTVELKANEDPGKGTYYSTFYSSLESYAVPNGFTAYRGQISADGKKLSLTSIEDGVMSRGEGYILKGTENKGTMEVTANTNSGSTDNKLLGTDLPIAELEANDYALSYGANGVGFYLWDRKSIDANKAYLKLSETIPAKSLIFEFNDDPSGIESIVQPYNRTTETYNLNGIRVNDNYKGIVIKNNKKYIAK